MGFTRQGMIATTAGVVWNFEVNMQMMSTAVNDLTENIDLRPFSSLNIPCTGGGVSEL